MQSVSLPVTVSAHCRESLAFAEFLVNSDLFGEIIDDLRPMLLIPVDPTCSEQDEES